MVSSDEDLVHLHFLSWEFVRRTSPDVRLAHLKLLKIKLAAFGYPIDDGVSCDSSRRIGPAF